MDQLNVLRPSIEPHASGHLIEQITMVQKDSKDAGYAYEVEGSVYFDVEKYNKTHHYGILSGRKIEDLISNTRARRTIRKKKQFDFAFGKKQKHRISCVGLLPGAMVFPGWHMECSAMGCKYLGDQFDIHGGGMDLLFPHHESEIAQSTIANEKAPVRYWMHNNMITINGQKMGKSLGNAMSLDDFLPEVIPSRTAYSPMTIRFFILQAHYRSTLDFSNEALQAAEKGLKKLLAAAATLKKLKTDNSAPSTGVDAISKACYEAMNDDFNSPMVIASTF
jgi:cysteinyl-tRNA synthetase